MIVVMEEQRQRMRWDCDSMMGVGGR